MQTITSTEQISELKDNQIIGEFNFVNSRISFKGKNNILITPPEMGFFGKRNKVTLTNTIIEFNNDNSVIFLGENKHGLGYSLALSMHHNSFCYIGIDNGFNGRLTMQCSEQCNILIGDECLFSFGIWLRTSDVHLIYDIKNHSRINASQSIFIGDHVWIGQNATVLKGTQIGSGSIIGATSLLAGKKVSSNTVWGGNPAKLIRSGCFFLPDSAHSFSDAETEKWSEYSGDEYIYEFNIKQTLDLLDFEKKIISLATSKKRAEFLIDFNSKKSKNRFFIE